MSRRLLGLSWEPMQLGDVEAVPDAREEALRFVSAHYAQIFGHPGEHGAYLPEGMTPAKARFLEEMDVFTFRKSGVVVGISMSHPTDWTSYYFRSFALLPEARERGVLPSFLQRCYPTLAAHGVARVEAECLPTNAAIVRVLGAEGWIPTGSVASERWGYLVRLTRHLAPEAREAFRQVFAPMPTPTPRRTP